MKKDLILSAEFTTTAVKKFKKVDCRWQSKVLNYNCYNRGIGKMFIRGKGEKSLLSEFQSFFCVVKVAEILCKWCKLCYIPV